MTGNYRRIRRSTNTYLPANVISRDRPETQIFSIRRNPSLSARCANPNARHQTIAQRVACIENEMSDINNILLNQTDELTDHEHRISQLEHVHGITGTHATATSSSGDTASAPFEAMLASHIHPDSHHSHSGHKKHPKSKHHRRHRRSTSDSDSCSSSDEESCCSECENKPRRRSRCKGKCKQSCNQCNQMACPVPIPIGPCAGPMPGPCVGPMPGPCPAPMPGPVGGPWMGGPMGPMGGPGCGGFPMGGGMAYSEGGFVTGGYGGPVPFAGPGPFPGQFGSPGFSGPGFGPGCGFPGGGMMPFGAGICNFCGVNCGGACPGACGANVEGNCGGNCGDCEGGACELPKKKKACCDDCDEGKSCKGKKNVNDSDGELSDFDDGIPSDLSDFDDSRCKKKKMIVRA